MKKIVKAIKLIGNPAKMVVRLNSHGFARLFSDKFFLKCEYKYAFGKKLNLKDPQTFNEKLQWLKLYNRRPEYTAMVDKYEVKKYVADIIGEEYIIPTLGVWDRFEDINFETLPDQFVLKCTHDSGGLVICKDKATLDLEKARKKIEWSLKRNFFHAHREWPYKNVKPRIIAEQYMEDAGNSDLMDYKFMCFNGELKCTFVCSDRFTKEGLHVTFFDNEWNVMPFERHYPSQAGGIPKPVNFEKMKSFAMKLSSNIPFVRVDFYEINGKVYFGELTFFPGGGMEEFSPEEWDFTLGDWINFPTEQIEKGNKRR